MAVGYCRTNAVTAAVAAAVNAARDAGTAAVIEIYAGAVPANADATPSSPTTLAVLTCSGTAVTSITDTGSGSRSTFAAITADSSADNTGTAAYGRIKTQSGGTVTEQFTVGTSSADLILNTVSITSGSTVSISAATVDDLEGP